MFPGHPLAPKEGSENADQENDSEVHESDDSEEGEGASSMGSVSDAPKTVVVLHLPRMPTI